ncbi:hypothetical protein [Niabella beijingensis]|uniref:hypothetical protein n=1 Tax=Niabella beijingensis TaxID=2872700 RepID=UPI001CBDD426|nr:hypothetical protein [Niabella beijingensis]MBZ4190434.1 hypothetical protein [Niabella beijingensis]
MWSNKIFENTAVEKGIRIAYYALMGVLVLLLLTTPLWNHLETFAGWGLFIGAVGTFLSVKNRNIGFLFYSLCIVLLLLLYFFAFI